MGQYHNMNCKVFTISCLLVLAGAAPSPNADAEADADAHYLPYGHLAAPHALLPAAAANCEVAEVILITQTCTPTAENVCTKQTIETEEIEYEKVCKEVVDTVCDAPLAHHGLHKREADAEADADSYYGGYVAHHVAVPVAHHVPVATAVAHSVTATVKHACREV